MPPPGWRLCGRGTIFDGHSSDNTIVPPDRRTARAGADAKCIHAQPVKFDFEGDDVPVEDLVGAILTGAHFQASARTQINIGLGNSDALPSQHQNGVKTAADDRLGGGGGTRWDAGQQDSNDERTDMHLNDSCVAAGLLDSRCRTIRTDAMRFNPDLK